MRKEIIYSKNAAYQKFEVLKTNRQKRHRYGEFFVEGVRNINYAVENGWAFSAFLFDADRELSGWAEEKLATVPCEVHYALKNGLLAELSGKADTSELLAVVKMRNTPLTALPRPKTPLYILFDRPSNRGNLGTIIRSADAFGADALITTGHAVDLYDPEVVTSTMGSFFSVPTFHAGDNGSLFALIEDLRQEYPGFQVVGTTAHNETPLKDVDFSRPTMLLIGNETDGLSRAFKEMSDVLATIPMAETSAASSFNVACAATVMLYEARRQLS